MMNKHIILKIIELTILFICIPFLLLIDLPRWIYPLLMLSGLFYCILIGIKKESIISKGFFGKLNWIALRFILIRFVIVALISMGLMFFFDRENLFSIVVNNRRLWFMISIFYSFFSVFPQEFLFRTYFFKRYENVITMKPNYFVIFNAALFALAHLFFGSIPVLFLTFIGGIFFASTYMKTRSILLVSIEHALYGFWLFTLGAGGMLAFPTG
jgi:CAAX protease family protein